MNHKRLCTVVSVALLAVGGCVSQREVQSTSTPPMETLVTTKPGVDPIVDRIGIGESVQGRQIEVWHRSDVSGAPSSDDSRRIVVLVIGSIHGNEPAGLDIVDVLASMPSEEIVEFGSIDLWLMPTGNPDGIAAGTRHNANQVDLNRNFPHNWAPLQQPGDYEYAGSGPASEPETQAMMSFIEEIRPDLTVWFHQDVYRVPPSRRADRAVREMYAFLTGLPLLAVEGGTYTGVAATWHRETFGDVSFIVELGETLTPDEAVMHARAVLAVTSIVREDQTHVPTVGG